MHGLVFICRQRRRRGDPLRPGDSVRVSVLAPSAAMDPGLYAERFGNVSLHEWPPISGLSSMSFIKVFAAVCVRVSLWLGWVKCFYFVYFGLNPEIVFPFHSV